MGVKDAVEKIWDKLSKGGEEIEEVHFNFLVRKEGGELKVFVQPSGYYNTKGLWFPLYVGTRGKFGAAQYEQEIKNE